MFLILGPSHIFGMSEAVHFKFGVLTFGVKFKSISESTDDVNWWFLENRLLLDPSKWKRCCVARGRSATM